MRARPLSLILLTASALALAACGKGEVKTGSLTQRFQMIGAEGKQYGVVELDPVTGGTVYDAQGRVIGHIMQTTAAPVATVASASPAAGVVAQ